MKILVTGQEGYLGTVLVPRLLEAGHEVVGCDAGYFEGCDFSPLETRIPNLAGDIRQIETRQLMGVEAVIHLAALSNDPMGNLNPELTDRINHQAGVRLAACARAAGVRRFLFASSCSTYGAGGEGIIDESTPLRALTAYGESKVRSEADLQALAGRDFCVVSLRNATAYGLSPRMRFDLVLNNLVAWAAATGQVLLKSDGLAWRPLVHVEDIARAFLALLEADPSTVCGKAYNVGREADNFRIRDLADLIGRVVSGCSVSYAAGATVDTRNYRVSFQRLRQEVPAFQPAWDARRGIRQVYQALQEQRLSPETFEGPRFSRLPRLLDLQARGRLDADLFWKEPIGAC